MEGSQRTTTRTGHLYSSTKKQEKQKQKTICSGNLRQAWLKKGLDYW